MADDGGGYDDDDKREAGGCEGEVSGGGLGWRS